MEIQKLIPINDDHQNMMFRCKKERNYKEVANLIEGKVAPPRSSRQELLQRDK